MTEQPAGPASVRRVLLLAHTGREEAREVARAFVKALSSNDIRVRAASSAPGVRRFAPVSVPYSSGIRLPTRRTGRPSTG